MFSNQSMELTTQTTMTQTSVGKFLQQSVDDMQIVTSANFTNSVLGNYDMVIDGNSLTDIAGTLGTNVTGNVTFNSEGTFTSTITGQLHYTQKVLTLLRLLVQWYKTLVRH